MKSRIGVDVQAMVETVVNAFASPCRRNSETVPGVDGVQVILNGVAAIMVEGPVIVNASWAETRNARKAPRRSVYCILLVVLQGRAPNFRLGF